MQALARAVDDARLLLRPRRVLVSRARGLGGLRLLQRDEAALSAVSQLKTDEYLHGWERGYDAETGLWDAVRAEMRDMEERRFAASRTLSIFSFKRTLYKSSPNSSLMNRSTM